MHIFALLLLEISCCWSTVLLLTPFKHFTFWSAKLIRQHFYMYFSIFDLIMTDLFFSFVIFADDKNMFFIPINCYFTNSLKFKGTLLAIHYHLNNLYIFEFHLFATWRNCWIRKIFKNQNNVWLKGFRYR